MDKQFFINIEKQTTVFLKGIAILFVLLGHMGYIYKGGAWGVSLFLMLSGYGVFNSYLKNGKKYYFRKKISKVYLPYLIVTIFVVLYNYLKNRIGLKMISTSLLGLDFGCICDKTMWYISYIFIQYIIFYLSIVSFGKIKKSTIKHILMIFLCFMLNIIVYKINMNYNIWGGAAGTHLYTFSFCIGLVLSKLRELKINALIKNIVLYLLAFGTLFITIYLYNNVYNEYLYLIYANSLPILLIIVSEIKSIKFNNKVINFIGKNSYDIYLWEGFFLILKIDLFGDLQYPILINCCTIMFCILFSQFYRKVFVEPIVLLFNKKFNII